MKTQSVRPRLVIMVSVVAKSLLRLYPRTTRRRFADDMAEVIDQSVDDVFVSRGRLAVLCTLPSLVGDLLISLVVEWEDYCRETASLADRLVLACLGASAATWIVVVLATLEWRWASVLLEASLPATMLLAFGLPGAALGMSRLRRAGGPSNGGSAALHRLSAAATVGAWSILAVHLFEHA